VETNSTREKKKVGEPEKKIQGRVERKEERRKRTIPQEGKEKNEKEKKK
jgi:hypothetical protein